MQVFDHLVQAGRGHSPESFLKSPSCLNSLMLPKGVMGQVLAGGALDYLGHLTGQPQGEGVCGPLERCATFRGCVCPFL